MALAKMIEYELCSGFSIQRISYRPLPLIVDVMLDHESVWVLKAKPSCGLGCTSSGLGVGSDSVSYSHTDAVRKARRSIG
ncbi:hypothetical protein GN244_ATG18898 [Phytophthora infestans]|uniref:Uncharacterized protein n=1 Tax=Phytophthora infestans TaxID=4787 RepID=A0A833SF20_PHYIN|nr:hypothetical protein GN244_ATG18898 [Phytophthora infestans]